MTRATWLLALGLMLPLRAVAGSGTPGLEALVQRAYVTSPALARAAAASQGGDARIDMARSAYRPDLQLIERWSSTDSPPQVFSTLLLQGRLTPDVMTNLNHPDAVSDFSSTLQLRQVLMDSGARSARLKSAKADAERLRYLEEAARREVRLAVIEAWDGVVQARAGVRTWQATVDLFEGHEKLTRARFEEGAALRSDLLSVGVRRDDARESLAGARRAESVALARLSQAVGAPVAPEEVPDEELASTSYDRELDSLVAAARTSHPLVRAFEAAVESASQDVRAATRSGGPMLAAELAGGWHGDDESFGFERGSYQAALVLAVPLYDAGVWRAQRDEARALLLDAEAARREVQDALELAARSAHAQALEATERIALADRAAEAGEAALAIIEERYRAGLAPVVELLEAERALTDSRVRALDARAAALLAVAAVMSLAGEESGT